jgi:signal transduction histidine kinase
VDGCPNQRRAGGISAGSLARWRRRAGTLGALVIGLSAASAADWSDLEGRRAAIERSLAELPELIASEQMHERVGFYGYADAPAWVAIDLGEPRIPEKVVIFPARLPGRGQSGFPGSFTVEIAADESFHNPVKLARWEEPDSEAGDGPPFVVIAGNGAGGRFVRLVVDSFHRDADMGDDPYFRLGEIVVLVDGQNAALGRPVTTTRCFESSRRWEPINLTDGYFWCLSLCGRAASPTNGFSSAIVSKPAPGPVSSPPLWVEIDLGGPHQIDEIHLVPAHPRGVADLPGYGFPSHFRVVADKATPDEAAVLREDDPPYPGEALPNPGSAQLMVPTPGLVARRLRIECDALWRLGPKSGWGPAEYVFALGELQCWRRGVNVAAGAAVSFSSARTDGGWSPEALVDDHSSRYELLGWGPWIEGIERRVELEHELAAVDEVIASARERWRRRLVIAALCGTGLMATAAVAMLAWQQWRIRQWQDHVRRQLARDLHDEIGASLSHLAIQSDLALQQLAADTPPVKRLERLSSMARETIDNMRDVIWMLAPQPGTWAELSHRLEMIARRLLDGIAHEVTVSGTPPDGRPPLEWSRHLIAFLKESLTNARRHARAHRMSVLLRWDDRLEISVQDDGDGFPGGPSASAGSHPEQHQGLANLRARAEAIGGTCEVTSSPATGTLVRLETSDLRTARLRTRLGGFTP